MRLQLLALAAAAAAAAAVSGAPAGSGAFPRRPSPWAIASARHSSSSSTTPTLTLPSGVLPYKVKWFTQQLDHFSFADARTFEQRWLVNDEYFDASSPKVFFYTGNEGDIELFWANTGFVTAYLGQKMRAMVVFVEHRYYGKTLPFGPKGSFENANLRYLTTEQALADYAHFVTQLKASTPGLEDAAVITFGGSYGGMLAGWARIAYPWVFDGAIAASAPVAEFQGVPGYSQWGFNKIITDDFAQTQFGGGQCADTIRQGFKDLMQLGQTAAGRAVLQDTFRPCTPIRTQADVDALYAWLDNGFAYEAMADYPAPANFLEPMPAYPINVSCSRAAQAMARSGAAHPTQDALMAAISVYYNYTGSAGSCMNLTVYSTGALGMTSWDYQACTEMAFTISSNGTSDMFLPSYFDMKAYIAGCKAQFGVETRPSWIPLKFGANQLSSGVSNIVFSNGVLDPWRSGGITRSPSDSVVAVVIQGGAHHLDMRTPNPADPPSCVQARKIEEEHIEKWVAEKRQAVARQKAAAAAADEL